MSNSNLLYQRNQQVMTPRGKSSQDHFNTHSFRRTNNEKFLHIEQPEALRLTLKSISTKNCVANQMLSSWKEINSSQQLLTGVSILKNQQLLQDKNINVEKQSGKSRVKFVYNDYHQKNTNPGYSRNSLGCYYTR